MTSQKSTNHNSICLLSLIREDLRHKTWMLALSILGSFLSGPVAALFFMEKNFNSFKNLKFIGDSVYSAYGEYVMTIVEYYQYKLATALEYLTKYHLFLSLIIAFIGAIIVALGGFRFLYHKRMVDLYHSAPVSRKKTFAAIWLSGFLIWLIPALVSSLIVFIILIVFAEGTCFATIFVNLLLCIARLILCFLIVYNACLVAVMFSGNILSAIVGSFSCGFIVSIGVLAYQILEETFYDNCFVPRFLMYAHPLYAFSPLLTPLLLAYQWIRSDFTNFYCWHLFAGIGIMILNLLFAFLLYLKRPSELSERGIESKPIRITLRALVSLLGGIGFTMIFYAVAEHQIGWMLFGGIFGSALTFCVMNVICHGTFKEAFSHKLQYALVLSACMLLFFGTYFDVTGYGKRLPKAKDVTGISIMQSNLTPSTDYSYVMKNGRLISSGDMAPSLTICSRDSEKIHALLESCVNRDNEDFFYGMSIYVKVYTKWGAYYRHYYLDFNDVALLAPIVETKEFRESHYPIPTLQFGLPSRIELQCAFSKSEVILDQDRIAQLMEAYQQDFEEHDDVTDLLRSSRKFGLCFFFPSARNGRGDVGFNKDVPYWYEHTISLIESWYPKKIYDPKLEDAEKFTFNGNLPILDSSSVQGAILNHYGFDARGIPLTAPSKNEELNSFETNTYADWDFDVTDLTALKEVEPYLIWGSYNNVLTNEYVLLGWAQMEDGGRTYDCFIHYGKLPKTLLDEIFRHVDVETYYWEDNPPYKAMPVQEDFYYFE